MNKFKVGDTIKLVQADPHACFKAGAVGTVVEDMAYAGGADTLQWLVFSGGLKQIIGEEYLEAYDESV